MRDEWNVVGWSLNGKKWSVDKCSEGLSNKVSVIRTYTDRTKFDAYSAASIITICHILLDPVCISVYGCALCVFLCNFVNCVFLLLLSILIVMYVPFCVFCSTALFCVQFVCKSVLNCCHRVSTQCVLYCCHRVSTPCVLYCCHRVSTQCVL
jgi:hypothetical protein